MSFVYLNGGFVEREAASISIDDRGFLFADGIYEVLRAIDGSYIEPERHIARLARNARELRLDFSDADAAALLPVASELIERNVLNAGHSIIYIEVTRGAAMRRHAFPAPGTPPTVYVTASAFTTLDEQKSRGVSAITHEDLRWARCDIKTINLLPNAMANQLAHERGSYEAIFVRDGIVTEGTHTTVLAVVDGALRTHPLTERVLPSVTRDVVLELAREAGIRVDERALAHDEMGGADELFLVGTTADVMPVIAVDGAPIGDRRPGPITRRLQAMYDARLDALRRAPTASLG